VIDKEDHGESDWDSDPEISVDEKGSSSDEDSDFELGRTVRKRTAPTPVQAPVKRAKGSESEHPGPSCQVKILDEQCRGVDKVETGKWLRSSGVRADYKPKGENAVQVDSVVQMNKSTQDAVIVAERGTQTRDSVQMLNECQCNKLHKCNFCGIYFEDMAMYFIHQGCHTNGQPWRCNVCGHTCNDRQSFFIHVTMQHMA
jgi:hypothetical protein